MNDYATLNDDNYFVIWLMRHQKSLANTLPIPLQPQWLAPYSFTQDNLIQSILFSRTLQNNRMINYREEEKRILDEILGKGVYDNRIRPSGTNGTGKRNIFEKYVYHLTKVHINLILEDNEFS